MFDEGPKPAGESADLLKIMMLTGSIIGMFSVFMAWVSLDVGIVFENTGYELFTEGRGHAESGYFVYMPLAVLLMSILAMIPAALTFTRHRRKGAAAGAALGVAVLVSVIFYMLY
ncbi:MAG: hypothetical protein LBH88_03760, partial [Candidatus Methanoplasma sp.]|nr:hypothetical protein [Candidatus Methanoplasma sp.]